MTALSSYCTQRNYYGEEGGKKEEEEGRKKKNTKTNFFNQGGNHPDAMNRNGNIELLRGRIFF